MDERRPTNGRRKKTAGDLVTHYTRRISNEDDPFGTGAEQEKLAEER